VRAIAILCLLLHPTLAAAFATSDYVDTGEALAGSERWSAVGHPETGGAGLHDGVQVAVAPGLAEAIAAAVTGTVTPQDVTDVDGAVRAAFALWESSVLHFDIEFDGPAVRGTFGGREIDVFAVPESDPEFQVLPPGTFGVTLSRAVFVSDRRLTNGQTVPGQALVAADVLLNLDNLRRAVAASRQLFGRDFTRQEQLAALSRLLGHEIGHAIGLGHPHDGTNFDTDDDPLDAMIIDPAAPLAGMAVSQAIDLNAIMSSQLTLLPEALLFTALRNDDRGGRDALYPAPADGPRRCGGGSHPPDQDCDDGDVCDGVEHCDLAARRCVAGRALVCDDGLFCNGAELCDRHAGCTPGRPPCDDANGCTVDTCDSAGTCGHARDQATCPMQVARPGTLALRRVRGRAQERKLVVVARGPLQPPKPNTDPTATGATLRVLDGLGRDTTLSLPSSGWARRRKGDLRYTDPSRHRGPCTRAVISPSAGLRIVCRDKALGQLTPPLTILLHSGLEFTGAATYYCAGDQARCEAAALE